METLMLLTVFTPTYNRAKLLTRGYEALCRQTDKSFIWLIIDDGSNDNTGELVRSWQNHDSGFEIRYIYKENGGLHTGYNCAIKNIDTELCVCIDSDDYMPDDAVEKILKFWRENGSKDYAGIVGLDFTEDGRIIGDPLPKQKSVNLIDLLVGKYDLNNGDRTKVVRTELYKKYAPMKVFSGEKNFNPHYLHLQISKDYDFLVLNENLRFVEYQTGGMTDSILRQYRSSPNSFAETRKLYLSFDNTSLKFRFRNTVHLLSSRMISGKPATGFKEAPDKLLAALAFPFSLLLTAYIYLKT